jgi:polyadenylate-binding protein
MTTTYTNSSLYVGDLQQDVNEAFLYDIFREIGPILSVKVCRDARSSKSLGYAYVNFQNPQDAHRAIELLNFSEVKGKPVRIMYVQKDPTVRKSGLVNIFIKNLDKSIENKQLSETFSFFGNILSCKVCTKKVEKVGKDGKVTIEDESLGYGFVHFETQEAAKIAIQKVNGMLIEGKKVSVAPFVRKQERLKNSGDNDFTNLYIKDLDVSVDTKTLDTFFGKFGEITSSWIASGSDGKSKGFAFINYKDAEGAKKATVETDGKIIDGISVKGKPLYCGKAEKKEERKMKLIKQYENKRQETVGLNVYVKNIEESWDVPKLREIFGKYGNITSATIMLDDNNVSRGFGFVCFETAEEAGKAVSELHGKTFGGKQPLYVALAQRKDERRHELEQQYIQRAQQQRTVGMYGQQMMFQGGVQPRPNFMYSQTTKPRWTGNNKGPQQGQGPQGQQPEKGKKPTFDKKPKKDIKKDDKKTVGPQTDIKFNQNVRNPKQEPKKEKKVVEKVVAEDAFNSSQLANMSASEQKQTLGDHLYPLVHSIQPDLASKITGMLLEMENADILHLLESPDALNAKIKEAVTVLKNHEKQ